MFPSSPHIQQGESRNPSAVLKLQLRTIKGSLAGLLLKSLVAFKDFTYPISTGLVLMVFDWSSESSSLGDKVDPNFSNTLFLDFSLNFLASVFAHEWTRIWLTILPANLPKLSTNE